MTDRSFTHRPILLRFATAAGLGLAVLAALATTRAQSSDDVGVGGEVVLEDRYPQRSYRFPNGVVGLADVVFAVHPGYRPLTLDLYLPPETDDDGPYPLLVYIHGGGWMSGHTRHSGAFSNWPAALAAIANDGFVVTSVEYRLSGEAPFPAAFDDVRAALTWLRDRAGDYNIDPGMAVAMGGSAGGQLAALVGTACGTARYPGPAGVADSGCVQGVIAWYGVFDFGPIVATNGPDTESAPARYLNCGEAGCDREITHDASPISFVDAADPPFLLIHGTDDPVVSVDQSRAMADRLTRAGVSSRLIEIPGVSHSFVGTSPDATVGASRKAYAASVEFLRQLRDERRDDAGR